MECAYYFDFGRLCRVAICLTRVQRHFKAMDILAESQTKVRRIAHFLSTQATSLTWHYGIDA